MVHVWHDVPGFAHDFVKRELKRQGQEILDEQVEKIRGTGATVAEAHLRGGRTSNEVIALSEEIGAGLLVVGSRGLGTVQRILMGSQSEEIVHHAHIPVLVLRGAGDVWPPERLIIAEDFSDDSRKAGDLAASIGALYGSRALLLYAHPDLPEVPLGETRSTVQDSLTDMRERDEENLQRRAGELEAILGSLPETELSGDYPATVFLEAAARESRPALVAVGSRGLAGITRTRLGSVSTKVVTASRGPCRPAAPPGLRSQRIPLGDFRLPRWPSATRPAHGARCARRTAAHCQTSHRPVGAGFKPARARRLVDLNPSSTLQRSYEKD